MDTEMGKTIAKRLQIRIASHGIGLIGAKFSVGITVKGSFDATKKNNEVTFRVFTKSFSYA